MRVHELAAELGITNDALGDFLEGIGEKRSHLAGVSAEAAELAREHFEPPVDNSPDPLAHINQGLNPLGMHMRRVDRADVLNGLLAAIGDEIDGSNEPKEHPGHEGEMIAIPGVIGEWNELSSEETTAEAFSADPEGLRVEPFPLEQPAPDPDLPPAVEVPQGAPADSIALVSDGGAFRENLLLDPALAEKLRAALKGRQCADACLYPERCELVAVTWPCYQKLTVRTDG